MKKNTTIKPVTCIRILLIPAIVFITNLPSLAQRQSKTGSPWVVNVNGGMVSFFGDLSTKDYNPVWKTQTESDLGLGVDVSKDIIRQLSFSLSYFTGKMKGNNPALNYYFNNRFNELQLIAGINIDEIISPDNKSRISVILNVGGGGLFYKSIRRQMTDGRIVNEDGAPDMDYRGTSRSAAFISVGPKIAFDISNQWSLIAGLAFRFTNTDLLDGYRGSTGIADRYSILTAGFAYKISTERSSHKCTEEYKKYKIL
ncbi:MAG: hypothetical protein ACM3ME_02450 [Chloroflexota bacterium]|nr:hypothetical protein [Lentimicrobium sp.]